MPAELEFHDSTVLSCEECDGDVILRLAPAILHRSPGKPGIDEGDVFTVDVDIRLHGGVVLVPFPELPIDLTGGCLVVDDEPFENGIPMPLNVRTGIELRLVDFFTRDIHMTGHGVTATAVSDETWLETFPGMDT